MATLSTTSQAVKREITDEEFNSLGYMLIESNGTVKMYTNNQWSLFYDTSTCDVRVKYGRRSYTVEWKFISIIWNFGELEFWLDRNGLL